MSPIRIGTAGWQIPKELRKNFILQQTGSLLQMYSQVFNAVEINSSFYRHHLPRTYTKWTQETPDDFKFIVKLSKEITHTNRLNIDFNEFKEVLETIFNFEKLGGLLVQLPPSLEFDSEIAIPFFVELRSQYSGMIAVEPRHLSWSTLEVINFFNDFALSKVLADPERCPWPTAQDHLPQYIRLHGSPEIYKSSYSKKYLQKLKSQLLLAEDAWVIFDNTQYGAATANALELQL